MGAPKVYLNEYEQQKHEAYSKGSVSDLGLNPKGSVALVSPNKKKKKKKLAQEVIGLYELSQKNKPKAFFKEVKK